MMYEDGFNIEEWKEKKLAERQETFAAQEEALKDVFAGGQTLANYFYQRGRLGSHITAGNTALILRANPLACAVMSADDWSKYGRRVSKGCTGIAQIVRSNGYYAVAKVFDVSQTYGNKPYPIAAVESTKQIEKAIDVMREISPIPVLPKNEVEGFCYDAERQELVFCAAIPPQELLQRLPAEIVMAAAESAYAGISENELLRQTAAISVEVCGRLGLPMHYIDSDEDAVKLAYAIVSNTKPKDAPASGGDKFWDDASVLLISALILYLIYEAPVSEQNFSTLMYMIQNCQMEEGNMGPNPLEMLFNELQERDPLHPAVLQFNSFKLGSTKTLQSVLITASANLYMFNTAQFAEMTNTDTMFLPRLGLEKRVIFCVIPDNDKTYNFLITMLYTQLFDQLFRLADSEPKFDGALPIHVRFMMDEFANVALPANFKNILAVCRSRNISCDIILQSKSQIQSLYKDDWEGMIGNCDSLIYLGGNEYATFEWLSKYIGKMTERTKSQSIGRGSRGSSSDSYQLTARDLCSPDEIRRMDDGDCLVLLRSEPPVIDHKFDLMRHPNVKRTPDGGAAPYRMPDDYAQTAQTISPDVVTELTEPAITDVMYEEIKKIMEEIHNEQERKL